MTYGIRIVGLQEVKRALGQDFRPAIRAAIMGVAGAVQGELSTPPGPVKLPLEFKSAKQRGWFFGRYLPDRKRRGLGRWKRESDPDSQGLLKSWVIAPKGGLSVVISPTATYAKWVQSAQYQQPMHRNTGWITDQQAVRKVVVSGAVKRIVVQAMVAGIKKRMRAA